MYGANELRRDAAGYGVVLYIARGGVLLERHPTYLSPHPHPLFLRERDNFLHSLYAFVRTSRPLTVYRGHGADGTAQARMLGRYWSPTRPALAIDRLGYSSEHNRLRAGQAVLNEWNPLIEVVEAELAEGSSIFLGRTAPQSQNEQSYAGGSIQFFINTAGATGSWDTDLPKISHQLTIKRRHPVSG